MAEPIKPPRRHARNDLSAAYIRERLIYEPVQGIFCWRTGHCPNKIAGHARKDKYITIRLDGRNYRAHRLAWIYIYGVWPIFDIDHIDGNPSNNSITNLREATPSLNGGNQRIADSSTTKFKGVSIHRDTSKYQSGIRVNRRRIHLGLFDDPKAAAIAYNEAAVKHFGEFAKLNIIDERRRS